MRKAKTACLIFKKLRYPRLLANAFVVVIATINVSIKCVRKPIVKLFVTSCFSVASVLSFTGCATSSSDIAPVYISPMQYQSYDCEQLGAEAVRIQARIGQVGGRLDQAASNDKMITGAGAILFWPALFFLGGTKQQEADYARLKGEYDAVHQASIAKKCSAAVVAPSAPKPATPIAPASAASSV